MKEVIILKRGERSFQFKQNYLMMREKNISVQIIAEMYNLSLRYAYTLIREISEETGIPYSSLLYHPHSISNTLRSKTVKPVKHVDFSGFEQEFRDGISSFGETISQMNKALKEWPTMPEDLEEV